MATNTFPSRSDATKARRGELTATDIASAFLAPLASLKLAVFLLVTAIAVIFIATLQQASVDMWTVKNMHYDNWFVTIPFQALLIERWFPDYQNVQGSFIIPSGKLIIYALIVNLVAAHLLRFRIKATGVKLWLGIVTAVIAAVVTWAMSFNTFDSNGFQKAPPVSYAQMWLIMQVILLGLSLSCIAGIFLTDSGKRIEKSILFTFAFLAAAVLGITIFLGKDAFIGDSGMRILWQLGQSTVAACVAWGACILLFQRKAGIVLLHFGVVGLMANELYVTYTNEESKIQFVEGETTSQAIDIRATEFAILDRSDPASDLITVVPEAVLKSGNTINDDRLPFSVRCVTFYDNSAVEQGVPEDTKSLEGIGKRFRIIDLPINTGDQVDTATAKVEIISKSGEPLGTWLVSQALKDFVDTVTVDGKEYALALRFKTEYKPYSLKLNDVKAEYYTGTEKPRWFSSKIELTDLESKSTTEHEIHMNNPLRYDGETFYQANYIRDGSQEISAIQVVKNQGWMIPYICCMFTVVGLVGQFGSSLLAHLQKSQSRPPKESVAELLEPKTKSSRWKSAGFLIPAGIAAVFALYAVSGLSKSLRPIEHESGMRLDRFGEIPMTNKGRIQPLDSFARNTARQFSKREFVFDKDLKKQPAIRWMADTMFKADGYDEYRVFRIEDLEILDSLDLPKEAGSGEPKDVRFRYSLKQLKNAPSKIIPILPKPETPSSQRSQYQMRMQTVLSRLQRVLTLSVVLPNASSTAVDRLDTQRGRIVTQIGGKSFPASSNPEHWPRFVPKGSEWELISKADNKRWLLDQAKEFGVATVMSLYPKLLEKSGEVSEYRTNETLSVLQEIDLGRVLFTDERVAAAMEAGAKTREDITKAIMDSPDGVRIKGMIFDESDRLLNGILANMNGDENKIDVESDSLDLKLPRLLNEMGTAYRAGQSEKFNSLTDQYLAMVKETDEVKGFVGKMSVEKIYNGWSPFYMSMVLYLIGFVAVAFSWFMSFDQKLSKIFGRTAIGIVLVALLIQTIGLVMRVYISGRPPITNLYSSALFVSAIFVAVMLIVEMITRLGVGTAMAAIGAYAALLWAWTMSIIDGDTFSVLVAVLDTQFWLSTHVVCITIGYGVTFAAGFLALGYILASMFTPVIDKRTRRVFSNVIYGITCFALFFSFFGTVLGGLWGDDSWGRFWGWDPKENGALMIVLWSALLLHARWGGLVKERGIAIIAVLGNIVVLWSWKGVNSMGVGLHAYSASGDTSEYWILLIGVAHLAVVAIALIPTRFWFSHIRAA